MQHMAKSLAPIMEEALVHRLVKRYLQCASSLTVEEAVEMLSQTGEAGLCRDKWEHCPPHGAGVCGHSAHEQGLGDGSLGAAVGRILQGDCRISLADSCCCQSAATTFPPPSMRCLTHSNASPENPPFHRPEPQLGASCVPE
ncbi:hypothetical protein Vretifemale_1655 [Volvox reticuliferus]|uniref:Uncharacterized protein n=1 Tax=Volvox reticuliferus TaxID=1737510 RepID=A0A8J4FCW3_9CHLO|nr:hypothetical protein Vretifemale_1655 [Volvox reticuliferus]